MTKVVGDDWPKYFPFSAIVKGQPREPQTERAEEMTRAFFRHPLTTDALKPWKTEQVSRVRGIMPASLRYRA